MMHTGTVGLQESVETGLTKDRSTPIEIARSLGPVLRATSEESDRIGTLAPRAVEALRESKLHNYLVATDLYGQGGDVLTFIDIVEELARNDASAGWAFMTSAASAAALSAHLPDEAARRIFRPDRVLMPAGLLGPAGTAEKVEGGLLVQGKFSFGSGSGHANLIASGATYQDGDVLRSIVFHVPPEKVKFLGNWDTMGLRGTGSYDYEIEPTIIPEDSIFDRIGSRVLRGQPTLGLGMFLLGVAGHVAVALGTAKRALEEIAAIAKAPNPLGEQPQFIFDFAKLDASYHAQRSLFTELNAEILSHLEAGGDLTDLQESRYRQAGVTIVRECLNVVLECYLRSTSTGLRNPHPLGRIMRDMLGQTQHAIVNPRAMVPAGTTILGNYWN
jgi:alkylation response protein AidB-like acyl-CoA dehydrogenase